MAEKTKSLRDHFKIFVRKGPNGQTHLKQFQRQFASIFRKDEHQGLCSSRLYDNLTKPIVTIVEWKTKSLESHSVCCTWGS